MACWLQWLLFAAVSLQAGLQHAYAIAGAQQLPEVVPSCELVSLAYLGERGRACLHVAGGIDAGHQTARVQLTAEHAQATTCARAQLELRRCRAGSKEQLFRLSRPHPPKDEGVDGFERQWVNLQHVETGCNLGRPGSAQEEQLRTRTLLGGRENKSRIEMVPASSRFPLWKLRLAPSKRANLVSCGGHKAKDCAGCSGAHGGAAMCNGECVWLDGACVDRPPEERVQVMGECLVGGLFGKPPFLNPEWYACSYWLSVHSPFERWLLNCEAEEGKMQEPSEGRSAHVAWLLNLASSDAGFEDLQRMTPWTLLDLPRNAAPEEVKDNFRELSRYMHPDKQKSKEAEAVAEKVFPVLQAAYHGLKDKTNSESFRLDSEMNELLFMHSDWVLELTPATLEANILTSRSHETWLLLLYAAMDSFSRAVAPFFELAAEGLRTAAVRVGAFGCGLHKKLRPTEPDPWCRRLGTVGTPSFIAIGPGFLRPMQWKMEVLPEALIDFGLEMEWFSSMQVLINPLSRDMLRSTSFKNETWIICFLRAAAKDFKVRPELEETMVQYLPYVLERLSQAGVKVGVMNCAWHGGGPNGWIAGEDCKSEGVRAMPDVRLYPRGHDVIGGAALVEKAFKEKRDIEVALETAANIFSADVLAREPAKVRSRSYTDVEVDDAAGEAQQPPANVEALPRTQQPLLEGEQSLQLDDDDEAIASSCSERPAGKPILPKQLDRGQTLRLAARQQAPPMRGHQGEHDTYGGRAALGGRGHGGLIN